MAAFTSRMIDAAGAAGGRFFLPYQLHYSAGQLARSYPDVEAFFAAKRRYDPDERLTNTLYERFGRQF
jgi:hypothetical protein